MAKDRKQLEKKKERERRVAKEKLAAAAAAKQKADKDAEKATGKTPPKTFGNALGAKAIKPQNTGGASHKQFTQRRTGGG